MNLWRYFTGLQYIAGKIFYVATTTTVYLRSYFVGLSRQQGGVGTTTFSLMLLSLAKDRVTSGARTFLWGKLSSKPPAREETA